MSFIRYFRQFIPGIAIYFIAFPRISAADEPSLSGEFPFDFVWALYSGPFTRLDRDDLLVLHRSGGIQFSNYDYTGAGLAMATYNLALYSFDGSEFQMIWEDRSVMLEFSLPLKYPITRTAWCYGDFDNNGRCSIVACNVNYMWEFDFGEQRFEKNAIPARKLIETPDVWIDQLMACDIDDDGCDELVALEYLNLQDSSGTYQVGIYKIDDRTLVEVWSGLKGKVGGNYEVMPPDHFISTCRIEGISGEAPVLMGMQSDISLSYYSVIGKTQTGEYELIRPFPIPQTTHLRKGERGAREEKERLARNNVGPVGGVIFNDGDKILSYGLFINRNNGLADAFALLENGEWRLLEKTDPSIGGVLCRFTVEPGRSGWLFLKDKEYYFYDELPISD
jgi:hypothetical protein